MKKYIKILTSCLLMTQTIIIPSPDRPSMHDCLNMAHQADRANNPRSWWWSTPEKPTDESRAQVRNTIDRMRQCRCAERAKWLDQRTRLHKDLERKCSDLVNDALKTITTPCPDPTTKQQAINFITILTSLGSQAIALRTPELRNKCYEISREEHKLLTQRRDIETADRLKYLQLLRESLNC